MPSDPLRPRLYTASTTAALAFAALLSGNAMAAPFTLNSIFDDPSPTSADSFGISVALEDNLALIGARNDDSLGADVGQAHLFDVNTGSLLRTFNDPTPTGADAFGRAVAIDGNRVLIGARDDNTLGAGVGQAHLFDAGSGALLHTFNDPTPTDADTFGQSVALDGERVLIGALRDDTAGANVGQAHLFDAVTGALLHTFDDPSPSSQDFFGSSLALDENYALIGARQDSSQGAGVGQAHLFDLTDGSLVRTFDDPNPTTGDLFGSSVSLEGNLALIGAALDDTIASNVGQAYLFDITTGTLLRTFDDPTPVPEDGFGWSVTLDAGRALIGTLDDDIAGAGSGQAHLFDALTGQLLQTFDDPTPTVRDSFGISVALEDGTLLVGAFWDDTAGTDVGQAYLFTAAESEVSAPASLALVGGGLVAFGLIGRHGLLRRRLSPA